jgi:hypothetical protein
MTYDTTGGDYDLACRMEDVLTTKIAGFLFKLTAATAQPQAIGQASVRTRMRMCSAACNVTAWPALFGVLKLSCARVRWVRVCVP